MSLFLIRSVADPGVEDTDDPELDERHWAYSDPYTATMIARGPTFDSERRDWTGSIHILDLPDLEAAHRYVENEPYHQAGAYREHRVWGFEDLLGRSMWDTVRVESLPLYFVVSESPTEMPAPRPLGPDELGTVIVLGRLRDPSTDQHRGIAIAGQVPSRSDLDAVLERVLDPTTSQGHLDIVAWEYGGRR